MKIVFLGTGTSVGVPAIGCECPVCCSSDPRNNRHRASLYVESGGVHVIVDTPPDFREQVLRFKVPRVDAVLFTHAHADHVFGFDDIRRYNTIQECVIPAYANAETIADLRRVFDYIGEERVPGAYRPWIDFRETTGSFRVGALLIEPLCVEHGAKHTQGYRIEGEGRALGYVPDCLSMAEDVMVRLEGVDIMILDALRDRPHSTHMTLDVSVDLLKRIGAGQSYITHMCHELDHQETVNRLPEGIDVSYDGLTVEW